MSDVKQLKFRQSRQGKVIAAAACAAAIALAHVASTASAGQFSISKTVDATVDPNGFVANSSAPYGRAMNGNSFETATITTFNGYQYSGYWQYVGGQAQLAVARRPLGSATWSTALIGTNMINGGTDNDAHNVVSLGVDPIDGTIHLAYDMHGHTLRYDVSAQGLATNPGSFTWDTASVATLFPNAEQNNLNGPQINGVTYPMFVRKLDNAGQPTGDLQFAYRQGSSGNGSWFIYDYSGATHTWTNGHQIDNGTVDTYVGTTTSSSNTRNNYPNNFSYGANGVLYSTFTWRESATGAANHDVLFVYSEDNGNTWKNNAGQVVGSQNDGTKFHLTSPGLVVRPLPESQTLMNQNGQAVDHDNHIHAIVWHRDSAKSNTLNNVWEPNDSSYFQLWRDNLGNWHENRISGDVGSRPKILFDSNDNAYAIYQVKSDTPALVGGAGSNGNLYFNNGDLLIAAATKASNWTDWRVIRQESGPFVSEAQADLELMEQSGGATLSVLMQQSPIGATTTAFNAAQARPIRSLDYSLSLTPAAAASFNVGSGVWSTAGNWSPSAVPGTNTVVTINNNRTAVVNSSVATLDNILAVGAGGSGGTLNVVPGGTLNLLGGSTLTLSGDKSGLNKATYQTVFGGSIVVGRDGGAVGTYNQSGGSVTAWRFAVGDYSNETSGGGPSVANVSGGSLTTYELDVAFSANGSSSGSSFNVSGGTVTVNGDVIIGEFGNTATVSLSGSGRLVVAGDIREGFNQVNTSNFRMDGGTLDMTTNSIAVDNFIYNGGTLLNVSTAPTGTNLNATAAGTISGMSIGTVLIGRDAATTLTIPAGVRLAASKRIETWSGSTLSLGAGAAVAIGTTPSFTADQVNLSSGGVLAGDGAVSATINNTGGTVAPGHSTGVMSIEGNYTQGAGGTLEVEIGGTTTGAYDRLAVTGVATLNGTLVVEKFGGFTPLPGQSFNVLTFGSRSGDLSLVNQTGLSGLVLSKNYSASALTLLASALYGGDANLDGEVDVNDLAALAMNWQTSSNWLGGDFNGDGLVNEVDLGILATNWQAGAPGGLVSAPLAEALSSVGLPGSSVPEPTLTTTALIAISPLFRRRFYKRWRRRKLLS